MTEHAETPPISASPWWGDFDVQAGQGGRWEVGPSTLWLYRTAREWRILHRPSYNPGVTDPMANRSEVTLPVPDDDMAALLETEDTEIEISRYSFERTESTVELQPALADRPVVPRPEHPLHVPSNEEITLYLSTPLWMRVHLPESERLLQEVPSYRMSDTWFGTSTTDGELCYATRMTGRLQVETLPRRLHRALTPLRIENTGEDSLLLERVQLPVRHLALYETPQKLLWTQTVEMTREHGSEGADIRIRRGSPEEVDTAEQVQEPRDPSKRGLFTSTFGAFGALFGS
ncbi:MAG: hypothetical protein ABEK29_01780 [Bradymonadaceae bacterium]